MPYSDFTLKRAKIDLDLTIIEDQDLFGTVPVAQVSEYLSITLNYNVPLALAVGTEKYAQN